MKTAALEHGTARCRCVPGAHLLQCTAGGGQKRPSLQDARTSSLLPGVGGMMYRCTPHPCQRPSGSLSPPNEAQEMRYCSRPVHSWEGAIPLPGVLLGLLGLCVLPTGPLAPFGSDQAVPQVEQMMAIASSRLLRGSGASRRMGTLQARGGDEAGLRGGAYSIG